MSLLQVIGNGLLAAALFSAILGSLVWILWKTGSFQLSYRYQYQRNPFDTAQYFWVDARSWEEADKKATAVFAGMFDRGETIVTTFYRA